MRNIPLSVNTLAYHGYDFRTACEHIAGIGVAYIEPALIGRYYPEVSDDYFSEANAATWNTLLADTGLKVRSLGGHMDLAQEGAADAFRRRLEFAADIGCEFVLTNATTNPKKTEFLRNLERDLPRAESLGLTIALENPGDGSGDLIPTGEAGASLIRKIGSERVRLNYDFSNAYAYSKGKVLPENDYKNALDYTVHYHLKDLGMARDNRRFVAIGSGIINYRAILGEFARLETPPPLSIELPLRFIRDKTGKPRIDQSRSVPPLEEIDDALRASVAFIFEELSAEA